MQLVAPDVLAAAHNLSAGVAMAILGFGLLVWGAGWRFHRFLVVFAITLTAGSLGLQAGRESAGQQVLVVGVLVAVAAGVLALELAKLIAFLTGGVAAWVGVQALMPQALELWAIFLSGGLFGVVLYRFWTMLTTSFLGTLVVTHAALIVAGGVGKFDASLWVSSRSGLFNSLVIALTILGVVVQAKTTNRTESAADPVDAEDESHAPVVPLQLELTPQIRRSWAWLRSMSA